MKNITFNRISFRAFPVLGVLCFIIFGAVNLLAQTAMVTNNFVYYSTTTYANYQCVLTTEQINSLTSDSLGNRSFLYKDSNANPPVVNGYGSQSTDPWVNSGLIEFDQIYPNSSTINPSYPNHCLSLCAEVTCTNPVRMVETSNSTGTSVVSYVSSGDFPIQTILFDIFKYQANANPYSADSAPAIRSIAMYPYEGSDVDNICKGVYAYCPAGKDCTNDPTSKQSCCDNIDWGCKHCGYLGSKERCNAYSDRCQWRESDSKCIGIGGATSFSCSGNTREACESNDGCIFNIQQEDSTDPIKCADTSKNFDTKEQCVAGITTLHFCTPWDGTYEIDGEFGKSNGQFGYRTTIKTNYPGDGISVTSDLNIEHMIVYPGDTQIPIQVDVTNVHSVRSSPTLAGTTPAVTAAPYKIRYRLSKDATTTINIMDGVLNPASTSTAYVHRHLVDGQPRDGETYQGGAQTDIVVTNEDSWDGRDDEGRLLPYGNYMVSIQASSRDEWSGPNQEDLSRAVTRQLSLDPLRITDIAVTGLSKESTAYAKIDYLLTEAATVHLEIYTPGTTFDSSLNITPGTGGLYPSNGSANPSAHTNNTGLRVASYHEQKARRVGVNMKWDGMCWDETNCGTTQGASGTTATGYAYGAALPDGDYVYLLWAEIPYGSSAGTNPGISGNFDPSNNIVTVNGVDWDGVKTYMIYNGIMPINRGYPEITIDSVSYSTIGSSPIANGLDPFVISYSLSRDSYIDAGIYTIAANGNDTSGYCEEGPSAGRYECAPFKVKTISENEVKEALTKNTYYWDGLDDQGRYVSPGNYMLRITAKDSLFPAKMVTRTIEFPVDMFRVVDVATTPLLETGSSNTLGGLASISYMLSKSMDSTVKIYDKGVIIPTGPNCPWPAEEPQSCSVWSTNPDCCIHDAAYTNPINPIKEFKGTRQGEGYTITDYWDGYQVDPSSPYVTTMMEDGLYPYIIIAGAEVPWTEYYKNVGDSGVIVPQYGSWHTKDTTLYASDKTTGYITVARGAVYFTDIQIKPTHPTQYYSSATVNLAPYEIQFVINRLGKVRVDIIDPVGGMCTVDGGGPSTPTNNICRTLTKTSFIAGALQEDNVYDPGVRNTLYWDGKDVNGKYVKTSNYIVKFTAEPSLNGTVVDTNVNVTVETRNLLVNNFQVFDRYIWDVATQNKNQGKFAYQISVPMKTAIQIFKPGTTVANIETGVLNNPIYTYGTVQPTDTRDVLVKSIVGVRPNLVSLEEIWDGTDYAGQKVPDGIYPYRYVTVLDSYQMNSITGDPILGSDSWNDEVSEVVMDWDKYINFGIINVVNGDSWYADVDWKDPKVTMFYPNPLREDNGFFEITKVPAPGTVTIKIYNIAGDLVRDSGYECVNAVGTTATLEDFNSVYGGVSPDWNTGGASGYNPTGTGIDKTLLGSKALGRNFAMRCKWDTRNNAGHKVARGLYYAIMTLKPTRGNAKNSQRVIKILIP